MLSKSVRCTENCNACSWHWSTERAQFFSVTMSDYITQPMLQKLNELIYEVLPHLPYSLNLPPTDYHFFKHLTTFCRENASTTSRMQKMLSKSSMNFEAWIFFFFFCYGSKQTFFIGKNVLIVMVSILINKDVFEPGYNELKFRLRNWYYFCHQPNIMALSYHAVCLNFQVYFLDPVFLRTRSTYPAIIYFDCDVS